MSPFLTGIFAWVMANPAQAIAIGIALYAFLTKKITLQGLIAEIVKDIQAIVNPTPPVDPNNPVVPGPALNLLLQQLVALLLKAKASGSVEDEAAILKVISQAGKPV